MKIMISLICVFCNIINLKSDTLEIKKNINLRDKIDFEVRIVKEITDLNKFLDGYIFFEIPTMQPVEDTINFFANIYYIDTIDLAKNGNENFILYNEGNQIMVESGLIKGANDSIYNNFKLVWKCFRTFNKDESKDCHPFLFDRNDGFTTDIFAKSILFERNGHNYFIYRIKLNALVYEYYTPKNNMLKQIFVPLTQIKYFEPAELELLQNYGFKKSSTAVRYY